MNLKSILCISLLFLISSVLYAAPHIIDTQNADAKPYISDLIVTQQPIRFQILNSAPETVPIISNAFAAWFNNVLSRLDEKKEKELAPVLDFIRFGADSKNYILNAEKPDIFFHINKLDTWTYCSKTALGCFNPRSMTIYAMDNAHGMPIGFTLLHEIGHALRLSDLYPEEFQPKDIEYGSGKQESIMNKGSELTCDDADAIVNALYISARKANIGISDLRFTSFCSKDRIFLNGKQLNRAPAYVDYKGSRTVYTFCQDGSPQNIIRITPTRPDILVSHIQPPVNCEFIAEQPVTPAPDKKGSYQIQDFQTKEILEKHELPGAAFSTTYMVLPAGGITLAIRRDKNNTEVPVYAYLTDRDGSLIYLFAYLNNGYNFIYNFVLNGQKQSTEGYIFIYNRQQPDQYFIFKDYAKSEECHGTDQNCAVMQNIFLDYSILFLRRHGLKMPVWGGLAAQDIKKHISNAAAWEKFLLTDYPPYFYRAPLVNKDVSYKMQRPALKSDITQLLVQDLKQQISSCKQAVSSSKR